MQSKTRQLSLAWQVCLCFAVCVMTIMAPGMAVASSITNASPMSNAICIAASWLMGDMARARATIAVAILGIGALLGKISWGMAMSVGVGISVVFGAAAVVHQLGGTANAALAGEGTTNCT